MFCVFWDLFRSIGVKGLGHNHRTKSWTKSLIKNSSFLTIFLS
ncbi:hypothetical protein LEP1GSC103_1071 [Leptospira borgpetersenii serovar Javanica str. UI 09931]|uniref:Uncharacterized protein n=5 Tax=Leptospira borgpetersenii TaxID=174 RepID=M3HVC2_LEPBO|nr:hypothetical protein LBBP_02623 [Leptospira borgpetersenii serovar Ballum]EKP13742.1 hypothetical protein LEP1GSC128_2685 [Leptospira borgpetersenii str. 200801926]EKQ89975.1 hypothetical protein LEP1GSC101_1963 [Leptospira borgpetersenii str. UI 09149]EKR01317.1 hypothetical protein LEP1GSC121_2797 [Leptospira borgpetersenii serovar Castellonis str. 200801910]EMG01991.1 hypothetical protein LEP1GSC123_0462 [Leptospira borgpetersenii str. 200701203]EMN12851.1 hypothetical protein LEP1GSC055